MIAFLNLKTKIQLFFFFLYSGLGYIIGAEVTNLLSDSHGSEAWRWGLRVTPVMGFLALFLILCFLQEPPRGESEGGQHLQSTSFLEDLGYLFTKCVSLGYLVCYLRVGMKRG